MDDYQGETGAGQLVQYAEAPFRRPLAVVIPLVLAVAVSLVLAKVLPKRYRAGTLILVEGEKVPESFAPKLGVETARSQLQTLRQEMLSRTRLEKVLRDLNPGLKEGARLTGMVELMRASIFIGVKGNDSFVIEFDDPDPKRAMEVANHLAKVFIEEAGQSRAQQVAGANQFIEVQLEEARKALEAHETEVRVFKERNMGRLPEQTVTNLATLQRVQAEKQGLEANLRAAQARVEELEKTAAASAAPGVGSELAKLYDQLADMRLRYTDEYPDVRTLKLRIERLQQERVDAGLTTAEGRGESSLETARLQVAKLQTKADQLDLKIADLQSRVELVPRLEQEMKTLNRDYAKLQSNYQAMLTRKMQADMGQKLEEHWKGQQFRILDPAILPLRPIFPNRQLFVLVGILVGLGLGVVVALGLELIDPSIKSVRELESVVPFPVLATLPRVTMPKQSGKPARRHVRRA